MRKLTVFGLIIALILPLLGRFCFSNFRLANEMTFIEAAIEHRLQGGYLPLGINTKEQFLVSNPECCSVHRSGFQAPGFFKAIYLGSSVKVRLVYSEAKSPSSPDSEYTTQTQNYIVTKCGKVVPIYGTEGVEFNSN